MKKPITLLTLSIYIALAAFVFATEPNETALDIDKIQKLTGIKGTLDKDENAFKLTVPRNDLTLEINGTKIPTQAGIASWISFKKLGGKTVAMGDLALLPNQINPIITLALDNDIHITALHNHLLWDSPRLMFMHIEGTGSTEKLASTIGKIFSAIKETSTQKDNFPKINTDPQNPLDPSKLDAILQTKGTFENGVYKAVFGRSATIFGHKIGKTMGVNTWIAFVGSDKLALINGDCVVTKKELQDLLRALNKAKINITSIHQHMVDDKPHYLFVHFYAIGQPEELAKNFRSALDLIKN